MVLLVRTFGHLLGRLPLAIQAALGALLGFATGVVLRRRRTIVAHNLAKAFPDRTSVDIDVLTAAHFRHLGQLVVEMLTLPAMRSPSWRARKMEFRGFEKIDRVLAEGRGAMVLTAHMGNWEIMTAIAALGYRFSALYKAQQSVFDRIIYDLRTTCGLRVFTRGDGLRALIKAARAGELIGVLADQGIGADIPFFGDEARFPMGAAAFHVRHGVAAFPVFGVRDEQGRVIVTVHDAIEAPTDLPRDEAEVAFQRSYVAVLEAEVRKHPEQYYWVHDVWRDFKED